MCSHVQEELVGYSVDVSMGFVPPAYAVSISSMSDQDEEKRTIRHRLVCNGSHVSDHAISVRRSLTLTGCGVVCGFDILEDGLCGGKIRLIGSNVVRRNPCQSPPPFVIVVASLISTQPSMSYGNLLIEKAIRYNGRGPIKGRCIGWKRPLSFDVARSLSAYTSIVVGSERSVPPWQILCIDDL